MADDSPPMAIARIIRCQRANGPEHRVKGGEILARKRQTCRNPRCGLTMTATDGAPCRACGWTFEERAQEADHE